MSNHFDVIIIGGGMAGLPLALCLAKTGKKVVCIDRDDPHKQATEKFDGRTVAISAGGSEIMTMAGVWEDILKDACPIKEIKISDNGSDSLLNFLSDEVNGDHFGHIIENRLVRRALFEAAKNQENLTHLAPQSVEKFETSSDQVEVSLSNGDILTANLLVGADGRFSWVRDQAEIRTRGWEYNQRALICIVAHEHPHNNIAIEDFRSAGPFAILPMIDDDKNNHRSSIVWTEHGVKRKSAKNLSDDEFQKTLQNLFPDFYGKVKRAGPLQSYPLGLIHAEKYTGQRLALISDAAHAIHPIAGQGLNIGLRDVKKLVELISHSDDAGNEALLKEYERARKIDNTAMIFATDTLNRLFSNNITPIRMARRFGLKTVSKLPIAKKFFMKQAMGLRD